MPDFLPGLLAGALAGAAAGHGPARGRAVHRRHRDKPAPMVRDAAGWRSRQPDAVLGGGFDLMGALRRETAQQGDRALDEHDAPLDQAVLAFTDLRVTHATQHGDIDVACKLPALLTRFGMARFYFDVDRHDGLLTDPEGDDLPSLHKATTEAVTMLREITPWSLPGGAAGTISVIVRNEQQEAVLRASLHLQVEYLSEKEP